MEKLKQEMQKGNIEGGEGDEFLSSPDKRDPHKILPYTTTSAVDKNSEEKIAQMTTAHFVQRQFATFQDLLDSEENFEADSVFALGVEGDVKNEVLEGVAEINVNHPVAENINIRPTGETIVSIEGSSRGQKISRGAEDLDDLDAVTDQDRHDERFLEREIPRRIRAVRRKMASWAGQIVALEADAGEEETEKPGKGETEKNEKTEKKKEEENSGKSEKGNSKKKNQQQQKGVVPAASAAAVEEEATGEKVFSSSSVTSEEEDGLLSIVSDFLFPEETTKDDENTMTIRGTVYKRRTDL